jgi:hypothetical protein
VRAIAVSDLGIHKEYYAAPLIMGRDNIFFAAKSVVPAHTDRRLLSYLYGLYCNLVLRARRRRRHWPIWLI